MLTHNRPATSSAPWVRLSWRLGIATLLIGGPLAAHGAGTNLALIKATGVLTLPATGHVVVTVTQIDWKTNGSFNVFEYGTVTNYDANRWTLTLPSKWKSKGVTNDAGGKLIFIHQLRPYLGTVIKVF